MRNRGIEPDETDRPRHNYSYAVSPEDTEAARMRTRPSFSNLNPNAPQGWDKAIANLGRGRIDTSQPFQAGDPTGRLPPAAAGRLRALRERSEELWAVRHDLYDQRQDLQRQRQDADARIRRLAAEGYSNPDHPSVMQAAQDRERLGAEIAALTERITRHDHDSPAQLVRGIDEYLRRLPAGVGVPDHLEPVTARLAPKESIHSAIDNARHKLAELRADLHAVQSAPLPAATVKAQIMQEVSDLASRGAPDVPRFIDAGPPLQWPVKDVMANIEGFAAVEGAPRVQGFASHQQVDAHAVLCWLFRDEITARLCGEVDELSDDAASLTDDERAEREAALRDAMLATERFEEELIRQAGWAVPRRGDADPRAVLSLSSDLPDPRDL